METCFTGVSSGAHRQHGFLRLPGVDEHRVGSRRAAASALILVIRGDSSQPAGRNGSGSEKLDVTVTRQIVRAIVVRGKTGLSAPPDVAGGVGGSVAAPIALAVFPIGGAGFPFGDRGGCVVRRPLVHLVNDHSGPNGFQKQVRAGRRIEL